MTSSRDDEERIKTLAGESLDTFSKVAESAKSQLSGSSSGRGPDTFASVNTWTCAEAVKNKEQIDQDNIRGYNKLSQEPAIARVVVVDENDEKTTYYICRAAPPPVSVDSTTKLASYRSHVGKLAALPVGAESTRQRDGQPIPVEVLESAKFHPILERGDWDSQNSVLDGDAYGPLTIKSLRALLKPGGSEVDPTLLDNLLEEESDAENVREGIRRSVITKVGLRDQPVLDQYQDDIFRLPLNSRLLILGAPGTGKTTTLIRRLGQKLDVAFLDDDERRLIGVEEKKSGAEHSQSWIMFTPTERLKLYVKEAFNREDIPASDERISTWADFRDDLARNKFGILRVASGSGSYVMKESAQTLEVEPETDPIAWFTDFDQWQKSAFLEEMRLSASNLSGNPAPEVAQIGTKLLASLGDADAMLQPRVFVSLMTLAKDIRNIAGNFKDSSDKKIRGALNLQVNRNRSFLDDFATFIQGLSELNDDPEDQDGDVEEEDEPDQPRVGRAGALAHYMRAVRTHARARARNRNVPVSSRTGRLIEWLGDRSLTDQELKEIGESLLVQSALRRFVNPVRRYINGIPARYRRFRRGRQAENRWYRAERFNSADIHPLEVDLILLTMIRGTDELIRVARALQNEDNPARATLERLERLHRTQVLVDEATDFSPIQLSCMASLARPGVQSYFACGDFNQRVTTWGTRSVEQMKWVLPDIETRNISVAYRQSRQLHDFARQIVSLSGGSAADVALPDYAENEGVPPVLITHMTESSETANWLAQRIQEIERFVRELPSIAVLVNSEKEVGPVATALEDALIDQNIRVIPCANGQVRGQDGTVRVFNVQHIKGLEFEAVFFVGLDKLAQIDPDLFDKYLYVGATRAAAYLGITCEGDLPARMVGLQELFDQDWS